MSDHVWFRLADPEEGDALSQLLNSLSESAEATNEVAFQLERINTTLIVIARAVVYGIQDADTAEKFVREFKKGLVDVLDANDAHEDDVSDS